MNTKLTLSLDKEVIEQAKVYAKKHKVSLSFLIENYLLKITTDLQETSVMKGSIVEELSGIISLDNDATFKEKYTEYLEEKYK